jgi:hypothetical protein
MCILSHVKCSTKKDPFPLPFLNLVLDSVVRHEMYYFMDDYSGYKQVKMAEEDKKKTTFILEWGAYAYNVMPLGLCNAFVIFQKIVTKTFKPYLNKFLKCFWMILMYMEIRKIIWNDYRNV